MNFSTTIRGTKCKCYVLQYLPYTLSSPDTEYFECVLFDEQGHSIKPTHEDEAKLLNEFLAIRRQQAMQRMLQ